MTCMLACLVRSAVIYCHVRLQKSLKELGVSFVFLYVLKIMMPPAHPSHFRLTLHFCKPWQTLATVVLAYKNEFMNFNASSSLRFAEIGLILAVRITQLWLWLKGWTGGSREREMSTHSMGSITYILYIYKTSIGYCDWL